MFTFMAGAITTGAVVARNKVERKSSARPLANLAITSAVAGATTSASIAWATAICSTADSMFGSCEPSPNRSVMTFSPLKAANVTIGLAKNARSPVQQLQNGASLRVYEHLDNNASGLHGSRK